jgi:hypothetical protein
MTIVIGKNSNLFKLISAKLQDVISISHQEVFSFDFGSAKKIFLFAWSRRSQSDNIQLFNLLPKEKIVFVSTIAVLAIQKREQWSKYPNWKCEIERLVLNSGGSVLRLGVCDDKIFRGLSGNIPYTSENDLINLINNAKELKPGIVDCFTLRQNQTGVLNNLISKIAGGISDAFPNKFLFQAPICLALKMLSVYQYGYTRDTLEYFSSEIQCGFGVLGSFYSRVQKNRSRRYIISDRKNRRIETGGFVNTIIGYDKIGLARSWHGVKIITDDTGTKKKFVPILNFRPRPPYKSILSHAKNIKIGKNAIIVEVEKNNSPKVYYTSKLVLAAGPLENSSMLNEYVRNVVHFSDHETGIVGSIDTTEACKFGYLENRMVFILPRKITEHTVGGRRFIVDLRPLVLEKQVGGENPNAFYLDSTQTLIKKIAKGLSAERLNEAIFNKFGIGLRTKRAAVCIQILVENCIKRSPNGKIERTRISIPEWHKIHAHLAQEFRTYVPIKSPLTVDAQHIHGGAEILESPDLQEAINSGKITILGSPTRSKLGVFHHTEQIKTKIKNGSYSPLVTDCLQ